MKEKLKMFQWDGPLDEAYAGRIIIIATSLEKARTCFRLWVDMDTNKGYFGDRPCCEGINQVFESEPNKTQELDQTGCYFIGQRGSY